MLDNDKWKIHTNARARKQKYINIYLFISPYENVYIYILSQILVDAAAGYGLPPSQSF